MGLAKSAGKENPVELDSIFKYKLYFDKGSNTQVPSLCMHTKNSIALLMLDCGDLKLIIDNNIGIPSNYASKAKSLQHAVRELTGGSVVYQQDNAPIHTSKATKE
ncbi:4385_t:CDS:2 [Entrophospora sp. SA101]|nr:4385_t:CDS:2 [Entrophospora sp. SA101]